MYDENIVNGIFKSKIWNSEVGNEIRREAPVIVWPWKRTVQKKNTEKGIRITIER
jgi:hypothetical protein